MQRQPTMEQITRKLSARQFCQLHLAQSALKATRVFLSFPEYELQMFWLFVARGKSLLLHNFTTTVFTATRKNV